MKPEPHLEKQMLRESLEEAQRDIRIRIRDLLTEFVGETKGRVPPSVRGVFLL